VQAVLAGDLGHVAQRVDDAGVAAACEHHQALAAYLGDERLVVENELVRLPAAVAVGLMARSETLLEARRSIDLAGDKQCVVEQERRPVLLEDVEPRPRE